MKKRIIECEMVSSYDKGSDCYGSWERIYHYMNPEWFSVYKEDMKKYTKHTVRIPLHDDADYDYEIGTDRPKKADEIVITWYWDKKIPFNFKHFDQSLLKLDWFCNGNAGFIYNNYDFEWCHHLEKEWYNEVYQN